MVHIVISKNSIKDATKDIIIIIQNIFLPMLETPLIILLKETQIMQFSHELM